VGLLAQDGTGVETISRTKSRWKVTWRNLCTRIRAFRSASTLRICPPFRRREVT